MTSVNNNGAKTPLSNLNQRSTTKGSVQIIIEPITVTAVQTQSKLTHMPHYDKQRKKVDVIVVAP
jgi:hypothetical protein